MSCCPEGPRIGCEVREPSCRAGRRAAPRARCRRWLPASRRRSWQLGPVRGPWPGWCRGAVRSRPPWRKHQRGGLRATSGSEQRFSGRPARGGPVAGSLTLVGSGRAGELGRGAWPAGPRALRVFGVSHRLDGRGSS